MKVYFIPGEQNPNKARVGATLGVTHTQKYQNKVFI